MLFKTCSAAVSGVDVYLVEVDIDPGEPGKLNVVGLPDNGASGPPPAPTTAF